MDVLIATHNMKKRAELHRILEPLGFHALLDFECGVILREVEETGKTFAENALLKARAGCADSMMPCIADDSGLCIDALNGEPGVYSARYLGEDTPYAEKMRLILERMRDVPAEKRTARFVSAVACVFPTGDWFTVEGVCEGTIGDAPRGDNGFGYDPIFMVDGRSFAELSAEEKDAVSHRGRALRALAEKLDRFTVSC
ncbi:MAG: RdgB/HAM1 family non-canonical purine NTP pyrophosphatase [Clostridia bacterium]|nr:RdgB/HAM1 family non-canonical purine NTP pyrophosphatase [Clostridia bacterium]MBR0508762.1 RdgB/HAM1 family non-canonical purine NTP pyrophosphatase [Clostridia bacterium]MBR0537763.1 RdgB/HAM1 family non-canonical purine NTP pyrophosphatase [Clostridia bacterium]